MVRPTPTFWTSGGIFRCTLGPRSGTTDGDNNRGATGTDVVSWTTRKKEEGQRRWLKVRLSDSRTKALASSRRAMAKTSFFTCLLATAAVSTSYTKDSPCLSRLDKVLKAHVRRAFASSKWKRQRPQWQERLPKPLPLPTAGAAPIARAIARRPPGRTAPPDSACVAQRLAATAVIVTDGGSRGVWRRRAGRRRRGKRRRARGVVRAGGAGADGTPLARRRHGLSQRRRGVRRRETSPLPR